MNFEAVAKQVFEILRQYNYEMVLFDDEGKQVFEPSEARRMFCKKGTIGVSVVDDGENSSVRLRHSDSIPAANLLDLAQALRNTATKYKMIFSMRDFKGMITPKDFSTRHAVSESEIVSMNIVEGMYGTSRSSYLKLENARMIVRHSTRINENILGARGRNVETIHIENDVGERYLMPTQQLAPARAMAHHVDNGGSWADPVGAQIARMAADFADLGAASRHIGHYAPELCEEAQAVRAAVREAARGMRKTFEAFGRKSRYVEMCESLAKDADTLNETPDEAFAEGIATYGKMLNTESVALSETVLKTVARVMEATDAAAEPTDEVVSVMGSKVSKAAWADFKAGRIDLRPENGETITESSTRGDLAKRLAGIASRCMNDSLATLLSQTAEKIGQGASDAGLLKIAKAAIRAAGNGQPLATELAPTAAVREFFDWTNSHTLRTIVAETEEQDEETEEEVEEDACMADPDGLTMSECDEPAIEEDCEDGIMADADTLTREDVLLPKNGDKDLENEVTSAEDDESLARITALAGVNKN